MVPALAQPGRRAGGTEGEPGSVCGGGVPGFVPELAASPRNDAGGGGGV